MSFIMYCDHLKIHFLGVCCSSVQSKNFTVKCRVRFYVKLVMNFDEFSWNVTSKYTLPLQQCGKIKNLPSSEKFRQLNYLVNALVSRNFCQNRKSVNFLIYPLWCDLFTAHCGNYKILRVISQKLRQIKVLLTVNCFDGKNCMALGFY